MITSKYILRLIEDYYALHKVRGKPVTIYENPTSSDLRELYKSSVKEVRFLANAETRKLYIWDSYLAIHDDVRKILGLPSSQETTKTESPYLVEGYAQIVSGKLKFTAQKRYGTIAEVFLYINDLFKDLGVQHRTMSILRNGRPYKDIPDFGKNPELYVKMAYSRDVVKSFLSQNWAFINSYISEFSQFIATLQSKFDQWVELYDK